MGIRKVMDTHHFSHAAYTRPLTDADRKRFAYRMQIIKAAKSSCQRAISRWQWHWRICLHLKTCEFYGQGIAMLTQSLDCDSCCPSDDIKQLRHKFRMHARQSGNCAWSKFEAFVKLYNAVFYSNACDTDDDNNY